MKDKEMIEEMARIIAFDLCPYGKLHAKLYDNRERCASNDNFAECTKINKVVEKLYNEGYRKIPEDARVFIPTDDKYVLLSKEEINNAEYFYVKDGELILVEKGRGKFITNEWYTELLMKMPLAHELAKERKETAEKFYQSFIDELMRGCGDDKKFWVVKLINKKAKQFGVEIKE